MRPSLRLRSLLLLSSTLVAAGPAYAHHIAPATYTGTFSSGGTVSFDVSPPGSVTRFQLDSVPTDCGTISGGMSSGNVPIVNHAFDQPSGGFRFAGSFPATQQASGTFSVRTFGVPSCTSTPVYWTATTIASPPAQCGTASTTTATAGSTTAPTPAARTRWIPTRPIRPRVDSRRRADSRSPVVAPHRGSTT